MHRFGGDARPSELIEHRETARLTFVYETDVNPAQGQGDILAHTEKPHPGK